MYEATYKQVEGREEYTYIGGQEVVKGLFNLVAMIRFIAANTFNLYTRLFLLAGISCTV